MTDFTILPGQRAALVDGNGVTSPEFYRFFRSLSVTAGLPASVDDLTVRVAALEGGHGNVGNVIGKQSIISYGVLSSGVVTVNLAGDVDAPPALSFYGAMTKGVRGWQTFTGNFVALANGDGTSSLDLADLPNSATGALLAITRDAKGRVSGSRAATITGTVGRITVANGDASAGLPTIDLATVADAGGGTLQKTAFDTWGRKTGTSAATTADLTEGINLYFTAARVLATILAGLSTATNAVITAADTVLSALGKLQAQITGNTTTINAIYADMLVSSSGNPLVTSGGDFITTSGA